MKTYYIAIAIFGEYDCNDAYTNHQAEAHTSREWRDIYEKDNCYVEVHQFQTRAEVLAFASGIERADTYFSSDYYTVICQTDRITDSL